MGDHKARTINKSLELRLVKFDKLIKDNRGRDRPGAICFEFRRSWSGGGEVGGSGGLRKSPQGRNNVADRRDEATQFVAPLT